MSRPPADRHPARRALPRALAVAAALAAAACATTDRVAAPGAAERGPGAGVALRPTPVAAGASLVITEMIMNPTGTDDPYEWFEVHNAADTAVNLQGFFVGSANEAGFTVQERAVVQPRGYALFVRSSLGPALPSSPTGPRVQYGTGTTGNPTPIILNNSNTDWLTVKAPDGTLVDSAAYAARDANGTPGAFSNQNGRARAKRSPVRDCSVLAEETAWGWSDLAGGNNVNADRGTPGFANDVAGYTYTGGCGGVQPPGAVATVTLTPPSATGAAGTTVQFTAVARDSANQVVPVTFAWATTNAQVVTVSSAGLASLAAEGQAQVIATAPNGVADTSAVTVTPPGQVTVTRVTFASSTTSFPAGFQTQLFATAFSGPNPGDTIPQAQYTRTWEALDPSVATIENATGVITGVAPGGPRFRVTIAPTNGAPFQATNGAITVETRVEADSASTYGNNVEFGAPSPGGGNDDFRIRRRQYAASYNATRGQPNWVSYEYDARQTGGEDRCNCFTTDPLTTAAGLPAVTTADYTGSGYSRGHMARSADRTRTNVENAATFYLTNIVPQIQDQNGGPWATLENLLGDSTRAGRAVYIVAGPQFNTPGAPRTLNNAGKVWIPDSTWKVALVTGTNPNGTPRGLGNVQTWDDLAGVTVIAVMMPNITLAQGLNPNWRTYVRTVDQVEAVTGYDVLALLQAQYQAAVEAGDRPPVPVLNGPSAGDEGAALAFNAAGTVDPDVGDNLTYAWDFGDGTAGAGASVAKTYADDGAYAVTLTVTDRFGWPATRTRNVTVANLAPEAALAAAAPGAGTAGQPYGLAVRFRDAGGRDAPWRITLDWGDGSAPFTSTSYVQTWNAPLARAHVYAAGTYTARLTVVDKNGGTTVATFAVTVQ